MTLPFQLLIRSPAQMLDAGQRLAGLVAGGELISLIGPLGSGKTQFVKGLAQGLGVPGGDSILSPTFVLLREYAGRLRLHHFDFYRLRSTQELENLGWHELRGDPGAVVAVEWADRVPSATEAADWILEFAHAGPSERLLTVAGPSKAVSRIGDAFAGLAKQ